MQASSWSERLGMSRAAINKHVGITRLGSRCLPFREGYSLPEPIQLLDADPNIHSQLDDSGNVAVLPVIRFNQSVFT